MFVNYREFIRRAFFCFWIFVASFCGKVFGCGLKNLRIIVERISVYVCWKRRCEYRSGYVISGVGCID